MADTEPTTVKIHVEPDLSGRRIGDYQLLRRLGRGGMADVYLAEQHSLHRHVAFKVLHSNLATDVSYVRRFHKEAQAAASLVHANIVQIHEVGCVDGIHFIVQEYVRGQNLKEFLARTGCLDTESAVDIMRQVFNALQKATQHNIVHRDIKPDNILLSVDREVKVADFGLARLIHDGQDMDLTQVGITMGTPLYMSPEQIEGRPLDQRSDIYSFGITCYHMLAGHPPFDGDTPLSLAVQHLRQEPVRLEKIRPDLPVHLCCLVHRMMSKSPDERQRHPADLTSELQTIDSSARTAGGNWPTEAVPDPLTDSVVNRTGTKSPLGATQRLAAVMRETHADSRSRIKPALKWLVLCGLVAALTGSLIALFTQPPPLLDKTAYPVDVPRQDTVQQQYRYGFWARSEAAWQGVARYFPVTNDLQSDERAERELYGRLARQRLAEFYLDENSFDEALAIFTELANLPETEVQFRAFGVAGQALVYAERGEQQQLARKLSEVFPHREHLPTSMKLRIERLNRQRQRESFSSPTDSPTGSPAPPTASSAPAKPRRRLRPPSR